MKLKYYGTGASEGWPAFFCRCESCQRARRLGGRNLRSRTQACLDDTLLIDYGADTFMHTLVGGLPLYAIHSCLITHLHRDHYQPEEMNFRRPPFALNFEGDFTFYGSEDLARDLERRNVNGKYAFRWQALQPFVPAQIEGYTVTPLDANHDPSQHCYIYLIEKDGKRLLYAHDSGWFLPQTWEYLRGKRLDCASLDSTMSPENAAKFQYHMNTAMILDCRDELQRIGCVTDDTLLIASHFAHSVNLSWDELDARLRPEGFLTSYDGMEVNF
jgi:phosphoribosyl 1,2-cyclic phosphate phosphodiesterase